MSRLARIALVASFVIGFAAPPVSGRDAVDQLKPVVQHQTGLNRLEKQRLTNAIRNTFGDVPGFRPRVFSSVQAIINAGLFELSVNTGDEDGPISELDMARICRVAKSTYEAIRNGAEPNLAEDIALVGFARDITAGQIEAAAKSLADLMASGIAPDTYQEIISQALDNGWAPNVTRQVSSGLIEGARKELDPELLALTLIIGVAQDLDAQGVDRVVQNAQAYVRDRQTVTYDALKKALAAGLSPPVAKEIYFIGLEEGWPSEATVGALEALVQGQKMGLTPEKLATSIIVRVEQGLEDTPVALAMQEEIDYVKKVESQRIELIQSNPKLKKTYESAQQWTQIAYTPPAKDEVPVVTPEPELPAEAPAQAPPAVAAGPEAKPPAEVSAPATAKPKPEEAAVPEPSQAPDQPTAPKAEETAPVPAQPAPPVQKPQPQPEAKPQPGPEKKPAAPASDEQLAVQLEQIQRALMQGAINDYLGTPYKWGGTAKKRGTDCSGFTQGVFRDGGVQIPRVSRIQYRKTPLKLKAREELVWGDLIFFNKNGGPDAYITHVGLYLGKDDKGVERFVHSCCSKGVTISRFNKRYYLSRFVGGARPAEVEG